jgi:hypothetical protein
MGGLTAHAYAEPTEEWHTMKNAWDACTQAGVPIPAEIEKYFDHKEPNAAGRVIEIASMNGTGNLQKPVPGVMPYKEDMEHGFDIELSRLPEGTHTLRVGYNFD